MVSRRDVLFLAFCLAGLAILIGLGNWQLDRRQWKEALIARMSERAAAEPQSLAEVDAHVRAGEDTEFMRATATGRFLYDRELFVFATSGSLIGWKVVTPLETPDGRHVLVDRGFLPSDLKDPAKRPESQPAGTVTVTGAVRQHPQGQAPFAPDNDPLANVWHWWDVPGMAEAAGLDAAAPFVLHADPQAGDPAWPRAERTDPAAIPNRHLSYAVTWFGLAAVWAVMTGFYLFRRRERGA